MSGQGIAGNFSDGMTKASTGDDGKKYFVPNYNYPWGFFYRKSVWQDKGYDGPGHLRRLKTLAQKMKSDGLIPIAFADKDGWPAMGTFDYLNMRLNGYQFHMDLTRPQGVWDQKKVRTSSTTGRPSCRTRTRTPWAPPGRTRPSRSQTRSPACTCSAPS